MLIKNIKFNTVVNTWLLFKKLSVKKSTFYRYKYIVNKYILDYFKDKRIYYFTNYDFNLYVKQLSESLAVNTINNILVVFKSLLKYIEKKYNLDFKLDLISSLKSENKHIEVLNEKEKTTLENYCILNKDFKNIGIQLSLSTGMRIGEISALKWKDIDLRNGKVSVRNTLQRAYVKEGKTEVIIDEPKSSTSIREIPIPIRLLEDLRNIYKSNHFYGNEFVLTGLTNKYIEPRTLERYFEKCLRVCKIKHFKFHTLRHTYATNCIKLGMDPKSLSILLGHHNIRITLERYVHPNIDEQRKYIDLL